MKCFLRTRARRSELEGDNTAWQGRLGCTRKQEMPVIPLTIAYRWDGAKYVCTSDYLSQPYQTSHKGSQHDCHHNECHIH